MTAAGRRDQRITFQTPTHTVDGQGSPLVAWSSGIAAWAAVKNTTLSSGNKETRDGNATVAVTEYLFAVRYHSGLSVISPTSRLTWKGGIYEITSVIPTPEGRPDSLEILATRRAA